MHHHPPSHRRGAALIIVLFAVVLISVLVVAFFSSVSKELDASKYYASGASAKIYADTAVNLVISQLRAGTGADDDTLTWVSQPGLIRQFDNSGAQTQVFKLYSSNQMTAPGNFSPADSSQTPTDTPTWTASTAEQDLPWNAEPGVYTDLNRPVVIDKKVKYPILNPAGLNAATRVEGFDVAPAFGIPDRDDWDGDGDRGEIAQVPMPVRWLYLLTDGRFATATTSGAKTVSLTLPGGGAPTKDNPPVARIAFWTDDDTSRLNVNTASEGSFWMVQTAAGADKDDHLSTNQLTSREYQRYPGHPATTSLSPVMGYLTTTPEDLRNFIFSVTPRISGRGSQFGVSLTSTKYPNLGYNLPITNDNDRLYASIDELLFLPTLSGSQRLPMSTVNIVSTKMPELDMVFAKVDDQNPKPYSFASSFEITPDRLETMRFFLTTNSRSPEVNLFGRPRISLWPVDTRTNYQSIQDKLLAFTSTANGSKYYFQREDPDSQTTDVSIPRNAKLLAYLDRGFTESIPGFNGNFISKYGNADRDFLRLNIFDWIRTVNLAYRDKAKAVKPYAWKENPSPTGIVKPPALPGSGQVLPSKIGNVQAVGRFPTLSKAAWSIIRESEEDVLPVPADPSQAQVKLRYRVALLMETYVPSLGYAAFVPDYRIDISGLANAFEFVHAETTANNATIQAIPITMNDGEIEVTALSNFEAYSGRAWGGTQGFDNLFLYSNKDDGELKARTIGSTNPESGYPYVSNVIEITVPKSKKLTWCAGLRPRNNAAEALITLSIKSKGGQVITTNNLAFPGIRPVIGALLISSPGPLQTRVDKTLADNIQALSGGEQPAILGSSCLHREDVVRGLELAHGDLRLLACQGTNSTNVFVPHKDYRTNPDMTKAPTFKQLFIAQAHSLLRVTGNTANFQQGTKSTEVFPQDSAKVPYMGSQNIRAPRRGTLVAGTLAALDNGSALAYSPQVPSTISDLTNVPTIPAVSKAADFSTGIGCESDGPHIMKADEGNSAVGTAATILSWGQSVPMPYANQRFPWDDKLSDLFSPNRQVNSAVQLGTLPSKVASGEAWRTLLFRPDSAGNHPGAAGLPDYLLLDNFWMPVVDPYPISEPFSTAGKINMNYQIAPFTYIDRSTGLFGAMKSLKMMAIPKDQADMYKHTGYLPIKGRPSTSFLFDIDVEKTLLFFKERFAKSSSSENIFKSAAEICSIPLAPKHNVNSRVSTGHSDGAPDSGNLVAENPAVDPPRITNIAGATDANSLRAEIKKFWNFNPLTGDNVKEAPYNNLYPRLTTQSNTYTVHMRVQLLQVSRTTPAGTFSDVRDQVTGEYRGSQTIQRYIDPSDTTIPDFAAGGSSKTLYPYYRYQAKGAKQFIP